jgi:hypothetical protein
VGIAQNEIDFANGLAVDAVDEDTAFALPRHDLEAISAEIGYKEIAVAGEGETVWQRSLGEALLFVGSLGEGGGRFLRDDLLVAVWADANHAAARIRGPQRTVTLGEDAFGPLQIVTDELDLGPIDTEAVQWICCGHRTPVSRRRRKRSRYSAATAQGSTASRLGTTFDMNSSSSRITSSLGCCA